MLKYEELPKLNSERWLSLEDLPDEIWKEVPNFEGLLLISNYARVINIPKRRIIKQSITKDNYLIFGIRVNGKAKLLYPHRLIAQAFIPNPEDKPCIDHIDTNRLNNTRVNIKWATYKENANNIITKEHRKETHTNTIFSDKRVAKLDKEGNQLCIYNSITEASLDTGLKKCSISNAAHKRMMPNKYGHYFQCKTAGGYKWEYI